jgi:hypothetical protein
MPFVELEDVPAYRARGKGDAVPYASRYYADFVGAHDEAAEFGLNVEDAVLGNDEEVAVGGVEGFVLLHIFSCRVDEVSYAGFGGGITITGDQMQ